MNSTTPSSGRCKTCSHSAFVAKATVELDPDQTPGTKVYRVECGGSGTDCNDAEFISPMETEERDFHPNELREATKQINAIFANVRAKAPARRDLSILRLRDGLMLAWTVYDVDVPKNAVTGASSAEDVREIFGLPEPSAAAAP